MPDMAPIDNRAFVSGVESALHNLYDPSVLRQNPLVLAFHLDSESSATALRQLILDTIEAIKPGGASSPDGKAWRTYHLLVSRYVEQFSWEDVSHIMGLSVRQLMREDTRAIHVVAERLWGQYAQEGRAERPLASARDTGPSREEELRWLEQSLPSEIIDVRQTIATVAQTAAPLLKSLGIQSDWDVAAGLPAVAGQGTALRQALLNVITAGARIAPHHLLRVRAEAHDQQVLMTVSLVPRQDGTPDFKEAYAGSLNMARRLLGLMDGAMDVQDDNAGEVRVCLRLQAVRNMAVLVIDDNADTLQLIHRYLEGTRYPFIGCRDPQQALPLALAAKPRIIILDVMLPGIDGWQLLQRLRENADTSGIPVIVCSILPEEQLALTLGASAYLRKPASQTELLAALDRQVAALEQEARAAPR